MKQLRKPYHFSMSDLNTIVVEELRRGKTQDDMIAYLQKRGWPLTAAEHFVRNAAFSAAVADQKHAEQRIARQVGSQHSGATPQKSWRAAIVWMLALMGFVIVLVDLISRSAPF
jgi:hypothetical protein